MSHIDSYQHEYLGQLGYLPIYRYLESVDGEWGEYDFGATPENLVLGGGSGEHSGLILHNFEHFVFAFLYTQLTEKQKADLKEKHYDDLKDYFYTDSHGLLEFCQWSVAEYVEFDQMARSERMETPCADDETIEDWLIESIGELVYYSLPEMNPKQEELKEIFTPYDIRPILKNVKLSPPGYPKYGGFKVENGKSIYGVHLWT